jgi:hypothetical protein
VPETKANDDDADLLVDETNKSSADNLAKKEHHFIEIDLMQDTIRKQLLIDQYRELWGKYHGYQSPNSDQKDTVDDKMDTVDKEDEDTEYKDDMDAHDVDEDEDVEVKVDGDENFIPEDEPDDDDEDDDDTVCDHEENPDDVGEDKAGEGVKEIKVKKVNAFETKWVYNYNDLVSFYNTNGNCHIHHWLLWKATHWAIGCMTRERNSSVDNLHMIESTCFLTYNLNSRRSQMLLEPS